MQSVGDGRQQGLSIEGLAEESARALGTPLIGYLVAARDQEHRQLRT